MTTSSPHDAGRGWRVDSHQHFWQLARGDYGWLTPAAGPLYRDYGPADLEPSLRSCGITHTVLVQAAESEAETRFLLDLADRHGFVAGVVGWLDFESEDFAERLAALRHPKLVGLRPMLQGLDDDAYVLRPRVVENLRHLAASGLALDVLTHPRHLPFVVEALERVPTLRAVLDHLSKPGVARGERQPWRAHIEDIARNPRVMVKVSGLVTEADHVSWTAAQLAPYVDHVAEAFGVERLMWGSDWPVCLSAAGYGRVFDTSVALLARHFDAHEIDVILGANPVRFYRLNRLPESRHV